MSILVHFHGCMFKAREWQAEIGLSLMVHAAETALAEPRSTLSGQQRARLRQMTSFWEEQLNHAGGNCLRVGLETHVQTGTDADLILMLIRRALELLLEGTQHEGGEREVLRPDRINPFIGIDGIKLEGPCRAAGVKRFLESLALLLQGCPGYAADAEGRTVLP